MVSLLRISYIQHHWIGFFTQAGFYLLLITLYVYITRKYLQEIRLKSLPIEKRLLLDPRWKSGLIYSKSTRKLKHDTPLGTFQSSSHSLRKTLFIICFSIVFLAMTILVSLYSPKNYFPFQYFPVIFISFSVLIFIGVIQRFATFWKYGESYVEMAHFPAKPGGVLRGLVIIPRNISGIESIIICLECQETFQSRSGKHASQITVTAWDHFYKFDPDKVFRQDNETRIPIKIEIPASQPECGANVIGDGFKWILTVKIRVPGFDYNEEFSIPVYKISDPLYENKDLAKWIDDRCK